MSKVIPHEFTGPFVNGERICKWCSGTPKECSLVFGPHCDKAPIPNNTELMTKDNMVERVERLLAENAELRAERDALLQKPIDLAKMDSIDDDLGVPDKMIAYYWWQQAQEASAAIATMHGSDSGVTEAMIEADKELVRDLHRHAFDDCGGPPPRTHIAVQAADRIEAIAISGALREVLVEARGSLESANIVLEGVTGYRSIAIETNIERIDAVLNLSSETGE